MKQLDSLKRRIQWNVQLLTSNSLQASIDATGNPLTDEALNAAKNADAVLLGAIGGPVCQLVDDIKNTSTELITR